MNIADAISKGETYSTIINQPENQDNIIPVAMKEQKDEDLAVK